MSSKYQRSDLASAYILIFLVHVCADLFRVLAKSEQCLQSTKEVIIQWLYFVFLVHVCAYLFRVLAHACAWEFRTVSSKYQRSDLASAYILIFLVHVCADLFRVLAKSEQCLQSTKEVIVQWLYFDLPSTCLG